MRICLLSLTYPPSSTEGIPRQRQALAEALARQGHIVHVVTCGGLEKTRFENNVTVHEVAPVKTPSYSSLHPGLDSVIAQSQMLYQGLAQIEDEGRFDAIDVPLWSAQGFVPLTYARSPVVVWLQTTLAQILRIQNQDIGSGERALLALDKYCLDHASGILADSSSILAITRKDYGPDEAIPAGIAHLGLPQLVQPVKTSRGDRSNEALVVGRLERRKGTPWLFDVLPAILESHPDFSIRFVGPDNSANDGWFQQAGANYADFFRSRYPQFTGRVIFEGYVSEERLQMCYRQASFLLVPSLYESFGLVYLEAMRIGLPVVTFGIEAANEIFPRGEEDGAVLVPEGDLDRFASSVSRLVGQPGLQFQIGQNGMNRFNHSFTAEKMAHATLEFYRQVIDHRLHEKPRAAQVYQVMEALDTGDAVSAIALENAAILGKLGQPPLILARYARPELSTRVLPLHTALEQKNCGLIFHYWNYNTSTWMLKAVRGPKALYYHNITPPHFFTKGTSIYENTSRGYEQLARIGDNFDLLIADSQYNLASLDPYLHKPKPGLPIYPVIEPEKLRKAPVDYELLAGLRQPHQVNLLFVGRIARNKRQDRLMRLFDHYYRRINRHSKLWLVGDEHGDPQYRAELEHLRVSLPSCNNILFTGKVGESQLNAFYRAADLFVCASDHEGFCIPIAEAMAFDVPVLAYAASAVPETMGDAEILIREWDIPHVVEELSQVIENKHLRSSILQAQSANLQRFSSGNAESRLSAVLEFLSSGQPTGLFTVILPGTVSSSSSSPANEKIIVLEKK